MKINVYKILLFFILIAVIVGLFVRGCEARKMKKTGNHSRKAAQAAPERVPVLDTQRVKLIAPIAPKSPIVVPAVTKLQTKPDLPRRKRLERETPIITGIRKTDDSLHIQFIDPKGIVTENSYPEVYAVGKWEVDSTGRLRIDPDEYAKEQKKKKRKENWRKVWRTTKTVGIAGFFGWLGYKAGQAVAN